MNPRLALVIAAVVAGALPGCGSPDVRVADMAQQVTREQAEQNQRMADGSKALAEGSQQLVTADANARRDLVQLQRDLQQDQVEVGKQRDQLERERQVISTQRLRESQAGAVCVGCAVILVCLAPLLLAGISLLGLWRAPTPEEQGQILVEELVQALGQNSLEDLPPLPAATATALSLPPGESSPDV